MTDPDTPPSGADPDEKVWWQSRTIVSSLAIVLCQLAALLGWAIDPAQISNLLLALVSLIGAATAISGRVRAGAAISKRLIP